MAIRSAFVSSAATLRPSPFLGAGGRSAVSAKRPARVAQQTRARVTAPIASMVTELPQSLPGSLHLAEITSVNYNSLAVTALVFILTFWGGISFVKGSTKPRTTQASFSIPRGASDVAKTVTKYLCERGFTPDPEKDPRPGVVTFTGLVKASSSVAIILVLVGASGLWAGSLILNVLLPEALRSDYYGWIWLLSFLVVPWYKSQAERTEEVLVMVEEDDDGSKSTLYLKGHRDELLTLETELGWVRNNPDAEDEEGKTEATSTNSSAKTPVAAKKD